MRILLNDMGFSTAKDATRMTKYGLPAFADTARERVYSLRRKVATGGATLLALFMAYAVLFGHNGVTAYAHKRAEAKELTKQMDQLKIENDRLKEHVDRLQNDPGAIEYQAREELHYTRAGEVIYTLPNKQADTKPVAPVQETTSKHWW